MAIVLYFSSIIKNLDQDQANKASGGKCRRASVAASLFFLCGIRAHHILSITVFASQETPTSLGQVFIKVSFHRHD